MGLGAPELILIGGAVLLLFGGKRLPEMMKGLGQGIKDFKTAQNDEEVKPAAEEKLS